MICTYPGCSEPIECKGLCDLHYQRKIRGYIPKIKCRQCKEFFTKSTGRREAICPKCIEINIQNKLGTTHKCVTCGKPFTKEQGSQIYCMDCQAIGPHATTEAIRHSSCNIIKAHESEMAADPEALTSTFLRELCEVECDWDTIELPTQKPREDD